MSEKVYWVLRWHEGYAVLLEEVRELEKEELSDYWREYAQSLEPSIAFYASQATYDVLTELAALQRAGRVMTDPNDAGVRIEEKLFELCEHVCEGTATPESRAVMRKKAVAVAAMTMRFIREVCDGEYVN